MVYRYKHKQGEYKCRCDISGFLVNASECKMQWDGLFVHRDFWSPRHPQDEITVAKDTIAPPVARPEGVARFIEATDVTAEDL